MECNPKINSRIAERNRFLQGLVGACVRDLHCGVNTVVILGLHLFDGQGGKLVYPILVKVNHFTVIG